MIYHIRGLWLAIGFGLTISLSAHAFSLIGPYESWMQTPNGFRQPTDIGGPMNLGEEYRWNVPVLTYSFDQSFLDYFGSNGVYEVEEAIQILNALPPASQLHPANYPPEATWVNYQAQALSLIDLKSQTLAVLLEQLGLAQPTRYTFNVHAFTFDAGNPVAQIVQRNFDPINLSPTNRVNDTPYDYVLQITTNGQAISVTAEEIPIDPFDAVRTSVAENALQPGEFFTGLTRDDAGGLQYLLRTNNFNIEILLPGVYGVGTNAGAYANQAVRYGVDKITFVRRDYHDLTGQLVTPYTNQFTDYYISNNAVASQLMERVVTQPDILFSAGNGNQDVVTVAQVNRTGTSNWWNSALFPGTPGPGLIRPPIKLTYSKPAVELITWDSMPGNVGGGQFGWGSFGNSTNAPVNYPLGSVTNHLTLNLHLMRDGAEIGCRSWNVQQSIIVQTSTNLTNWEFFLVFFPRGVTMEWTHHASDAQRYFRVVPNIY